MASGHKTMTVSVLMAVHNGGPYLEAAVDSILGQTHRDFTFVIVEDCSTDDSLALLKARAAIEPRIRLLINRENLGLARSLNRGLDACDTTFVARMDADDLSPPTRLAAQLAAFAEDPELTLCGLPLTRIDGQDRVLGHGVSPATPEALHWYSRFRPACAHPGAMYRRELAGEPVHYPLDYPRAEEYPLFARLLDGGRGRVLSTPRLCYRVHDGSVSVSASAAQRDDARRVCAVELARLAGDLLPLSETDIALTARFTQRTDALTVTEVATAIRTLRATADAWLAQRVAAERRALVGRELAELTARFTLQGLAAQRAFGTLGAFTIGRHCLDQFLPMARELSGRLRREAGARR